MTGALPLMLAVALLAQAAAEPLAADPRIRSLAYAPDQIVTLGVSQGYAAVIELADDEWAENVVVGNSSAWQVTANRAGDRVIVKPLADAAPTNLIVLTAKRRYVFVLDPFGAASFVLQFVYPQPAQTAAEVTPPGTYRFRGARALFPLTMYDKGGRTVIKWSEQKALPAVFALYPGAQEQLVNGRMVGADFVIEGAALRYKFRYGRSEATAVRQVAKGRP